MKELFRIVKHKKGYLIEYKVKKLFYTKWVHFTSYSGLPNEPYYYSTFQLALDDLQREIRKQVINTYRRS